LNSKLEDLEIQKVAFVPEGDNKGAGITFFKNKPEGEVAKTEDESNGDETLFKRFISFMAKAFDTSEEVSGDLETDAANTNYEKTKEDSDMNLDMSKLTEQEQKTYASLRAKASGGSIEDKPEDKKADDKSTYEKPEDTTKSADSKDIYKELHPEVKKELESLRKFREGAEQKELLSIAKSYELLGHKPEDLAVKLKTLKAVGGTAYNDMISVLDDAVKALQSSGLFDEVGKGGHGINASADAWAQIEKRAAEIRKGKPDMSISEAIDKACMENPQLVAEYEKTRA